MRTSVVLILSLVLCSAAATAAIDRFMLRDPLPAEAADLIVGDGVAITPAVLSHAADVAGTPAHWQVVRDERDARGGRHVFYQQYVVVSGERANILDAVLSLHYSPTGKLRLIGGAQAAKLAISNTVRLSANEIRERAALAASVALARTAVSSSDGAELALLHDQGGTGRLVRRVIVSPANGDSYVAAVDTESGDLLSIDPLQWNGNCSPTAPLSVVSAVGVPVRYPTNRTINANATAGRPTPGGTWTHEAYKSSTGSSPVVTVWQETSDPAWMCHYPTDLDYSYTLFPVRTESGTPTYKNFGDVWQGSAAGDAMYHTYKTMVALSGMGRNSWNGNGAEAKIVIESTRAGEYNSKFCTTAADGGPANAVYLGPKGASQAYNFAAALDSVAHEWGHGVIYTSANFYRDDYIDDQLHEGWADVIGQLVEKKIQPAGSGLEQSSDWMIGEDMSSAGQYERRGDADDGSTGHLWAGRTINLRYHKDDTGGAPHERGNMMNVVFKLLADGGRNPWCALNGTTHIGCESGFSVTGKGVTAASKILFETLVNYLPSNLIWEDLVDYAVLAAFDTYSNCATGFTALPYQTDTANSFKSIGYPTDAGFWTCE